MLPSPNILRNPDKVPYISFEGSDRQSDLFCAFSTRLGGVSTGIHSSMNLNFKQGDDPENVLKNFRRIADSMGLDINNMVYSDQTHTTNVRRMTADDRGKGILREKDYSDVDGMITNEPDLVLVGSFADCVPVFFMDPVKRVVGISHSGWKGTACKIGEVTVLAMTREFGTDPKDLRCIIGPSICQDCYEVSSDVAEVFKERFTDQEATDILYDKGNGKYQLDLWKANRYVLTDAGVKPENITISGLCTSCRSNLLWSHRKTNGKRGGLCGFICINSKD